MGASELEALLSLLNTASGPPHLRPLIESHGSAARAWRAVSGNLDEKRREEVSRLVRRGLETIHRLSVDVITMMDPGYPEPLVHLESEAPYVLFALGRLELMERVSLAVVGSRRCTEYGIEATRALTMPVARAGAVIVSGLALGIDGAAHRAAFDAGGDTIAVLGNGIDVCYPRTNRRLFERIREQGLLLTEFAPGARPLRYHFPHRNRIIAMLASASLVVEATEESGSLITARRALLHKHVMAVPGPIGRTTSEGCNQLIREGAELVTEAAHILEAMNLQAANPAKPAEPIDVDAQALSVWRVLTLEASHVDEVASRAKLSLPAVSHSLLQLELAGCIRQLSGQRFVRMSKE